MTTDQAIVFVILVGMVALFVWDRLRYDLVAMLGLMVAVACGVVSPENAFTGFSDQIVIIVASALILSAAISKSSVIGRLVRRLEPFIKTTYLQVVVLTAAVMVLSTFMKNIGALAIFVPIAIQIARRNDTSPSKLLMPMAFGALVGGLITLIGTSPNVIVSRMREELLGTPYSMFDFAPVGIGVALAGLAFLAVGWRLLPSDRRGAATADESFEVDPYLSEVEIPKNSPLVGKTVADLEAMTKGEVSVTAIIREGGRRRYIPSWHWVLFEDDILILQADPHALQTLIDDTGLQIRGTEKDPIKDLPASDISVVETVVMAGSPLVGRSAEDIQLRQSYGTNLLGISRPNYKATTPLRRVRFRVGDVLVLQGSAEAMLDKLKLLHCLPLVDRTIGLGRPRQEYLPLVLLALAMGAVVLGLVPVTVAFFGAAVLAILLRGLTLEEAYAALDLPILILLACLIPISDAVRSTGGADLIASGLATVAEMLPPVGIISLVVVAAMALTPFLNNAATVLIMAPVGTSLAQKLGLNPDPFLMAVAVGAACDFLTPIGHQCNTLVMGAGGYRFGDYWRLGLPLSIIVLVMATILIPLVWPLR